jgi:hypothetical protein
MRPDVQMRVGLEDLNRSDERKRVRSASERRESKRAWSAEDLEGKRNLMENYRTRATITIARKECSQVPPVQSRVSSGQISKSGKSKDTEKREQPAKRTKQIRIRARQ